MKNSRQIGIYLGRHSGQGGGIARYSQSLLQELSVLLGRNEFEGNDIWVFACSKMTKILNQENHFKRDETKVNQIQIVPLNEHFGRWGGLLLDQLQLARWCRRLKLTDLFCTSNVGIMFCPCPQTVVIHDVFQAYPPGTSIGGLADFFKRMYYRLTFRRITSRCKKILCDSQQGHQAITERFPHALSKTKIVELGLDRDLDNLRKLIGQDSYAEADVVTALNALDLLPGYILGIWSDNPRKNMNTAIRAWSQLSKEDGGGHLVLLVESEEVGARVAEQFTQKELKDVTLLPWVDRKTLANLYIGASILLFPSFEEGFGLPAYEMLAFHGTVVSGPISFESLPKENASKLISCSPEDLEDVLARLRNAIKAESNFSLSRKLQEIRMGKDIRNMRQVCLESFQGVLATRGREK